jgi:polyhydroxyalkanoate synthesis regulator phasin
MPKSRRRWLVLGGLAAALAVGAGASIAATGGAGDGFLADVARRLGISEQKLTDAIRDARIAQIDAAVEAGDLTEEQGERLKERARSGEGPRGVGPVFGRGLGPGFRDFGHGPFGRGSLGRDADVLEAAADYLGVTAAELRESLRGGQSLADVAKAKGKSVDGLKATIRKAIQASLDEAVDDGKLTKEQAERLGEYLSEHVDRVVEGSLRVGPGLRGSGPGLFGRGPLGHGSDVLEAAADYLGVTAAELRESLRDEQSLADVAKSKGKSVGGLKAAVRKVIEADLDEAVEDGKLTKSRPTGSARTCPSTSTAWSRPASASA